MCLCVFLSVEALTITYLEISFTLLCRLMLVAPSRPSIHAVVILVWEVLFHEMLFFQALSHDHLPVE